MRATFLGGAHEVGRLGFVLESGSSRVLIDYGLAPTDPPSYPHPAPPVDGALLTHAHLDHAGMMPVVAHELDAPIFATGPSLEAAEVLCRDALKVHRLEGYAAPYADYAISTLMDAGRPIGWEDPFRVGGLDATAYNSGHIPGSCLFRVEADRSLVFTGDLTTDETRLVEPARPVGCEVLVMEGTYAGRAHPDRQETEAALLDAVQATLEAGGVCIVPSFAVGRTQELLMILAEVRAPIFLDGMGRRVTELFLRHPGFLRDARKLRDIVGRVNFIRTHHHRRRAAEPGNIIVTTSGMLDGGPVLSYLSRIHDDERSSVLITGYQVEGTNGRRLLEEGSVEIQGRPVKVQANVERFDLSGHAGHDELVAFAEGCQPETIVLMHTEDPEPLVRDLQSVARRVVAPHNGEPVEL